MSLWTDYTIHWILMNQFWRLFTSNYVQDLVDSVSIPTTDEFVETVKGSQFDNGINSYKEKISNFFQAIPTFQQFIERVKDPTVHLGKDKEIQRLQDESELTRPIYNDLEMVMAAA